MALSKDDFLAITYTKTEEVPLPEINASVHVRTISGAEREKFEEACTKGFPNLRARLICLAASDDQGNRLFADGDVHAVAKKPAAILDRIFQAALRLNGLTKEAVDEAEGESDAGQSSDSPTDSLCL